MRRKFFCLGLIILSTLFSSCSNSDVIIEDNPNINEGENNEDMEIILKINNQKIDVLWEDNESIDALKERLEESNISFTTTRYGGFEQVGALPFSLPSNDERITTSCGDIVLYTSNHMCFYFSNNTWSFTRLGKITSMSDDEIISLLDVPSCEIEISIEK